MPGQAEGRDPAVRFSNTLGVGAEIVMVAEAGSSVPAGALFAGRKDNKVIPAGIGVDQNFAATAQVLRTEYTTAAGG